MSASFKINLDTTGPVIFIYAPPYVFQDAETEIRVQSNEKLGTYQDVYIVDPKGVRHDLIFTLCDDYCYGTTNFNGLSCGLITLYVRVNDEVDNLSNIAIKKILLLKKASVQIKTDLHQTTQRQLKTGEAQRQIKARRDNWLIKIKAKGRRIEGIVL